MDTHAFMTADPNSKKTGLSHAADLRQAQEFYRAACGIEGVTPMSDPQDLARMAEVPEYKV